MNLIICVAGADQEIFERFERKRKSALPRYGNIPLIAKRLYPGECYDRQYAIELVAKILKQLNNRPDDEIGIVLAYNDVRDKSDEFAAAFSPFALSAPFESRDFGSIQQEQRNAYANSRAEHILRVVGSLADAAGKVKDYVSGRHDRPINLPLRNFRSDQLTAGIEKLSRELASCDDPLAVLREFEKNVSLTYIVGKLKQDGDQFRYVQNNRKLRFKSPGRDKHGFSHCLGQPHNPLCHVAARSRLGAPVARNFHFDCDIAPRKDPDRIARSKVKIRGTALNNCHDEPHEPDAQNTHVNIAPNDMVF